MILYILVGLVVIFAVAIFVMVGLAVFSVTEIVASCEELDESPQDGDDDLVGRIGFAFESMLMPYSHISTSTGRKNAMQNHYMNEEGLSMQRLSED